MRYVQVPETVKLIDFETGKELDHPSLVGDWTLHRFLASFIFGDAKLGKTRKDHKAVKRIQAAFKNAMPGDEVQVESEDWDRIKGVIEELSQPQSANLLAQLVDFSDAWCEAPEKKREKRNTEKADAIVVPIGGQEG